VQPAVDLLRLSARVDDRGEGVRVGLDALLSRVKVGVRFRVGVGVGVGVGVRVWVRVRVRVRPLLLHLLE
jgi:hypothetical protein